MKYFLCLISALLFTSSAQASQLVPKWGFEKNFIKQGSPGRGETLWALEHICNIKDPMRVKTEIGFWIAKGEPSRQSSFYTSVSWGYRVKLIGGAFAEAFIGPGWIAKTDSELGGHFQIFHDLNFGVMEDGWGIGFGFKHISSAGIYSPNRGRDFGSMRFLIEL